MKKLLHILLLIFIAVKTASCSSDMADSTSRLQLVDIFNEAESTIRNQGNYPRALDLYLTFIRGAENDAALEPQLMTAYISVAVIYGSFNDVDNAIAYNKRAYSLSRKLGDTRISELALTNLAQSYLAEYDYTRASQTADSLLSLNADESQTLIFHHSIIKGEVAMQFGNHSEALTYFRRADSVAHNSELTHYEQSAPLELMADYYDKVNMPDSQLIYLNRVWELVNIDKDPQPKAECARMLMQFHTNHGNINDARKFQEAYLQLTDSLVSLRHFLSVSAQHQQSQIDSKGNEINLLHREAAYHRAIIAIIAALLTLAIVFIFIIFHQKKNLDTAYRALFEKGRRLMEIPVEQHLCENTPNLESEKTLSGDIVSSKEEESRNKALYDKIIHLMENNHDYLNPDFGLGNLVAMADSNVAYVSKVIKLYANMNVPSFINEYRVREACRRILDEAAFGNMTFAAIGESVGFSSQVSFNRAFKKATGMSPSVYHKMANEPRRDN